MVCAGVDPDLSKIPQWMKIQTPEETIFCFLKRYIDIVAPYVSVFKVQKAFFDIYSGGHELLKNVIEYTHVQHPNNPILLDCKIGDIGNTMNIYLKNIFDHLNADGVLVNPYMGEDVFDACSQYPDKIFVPLIKTSNPGGEIIQNTILQTGQYLWEYILRLSMQKWNKNGNIIPVLSQIDDKEALKRARDIIPQDTPILFAGGGVQGRELSDIYYLLNTSNSGIFVNSSRALMYPQVKDGEIWEDSIKRTVINFKNSLEKIRPTEKSKFLILAGVSGVGKTSVIRELLNLNKKYRYISPDITRPLREGERDKNYVDFRTLREREKKGEYLIVNEINGVLYATPKRIILETLRQGLYPILDFPITGVETINNFCMGQLFTVYLFPPSSAILKERLSQDGRDKNGLRFLTAQKELSFFTRGKFDDKIDIRVLSETGKTRDIAIKINEIFLSQMTSMHKRILKRDQKTR